MTRIKDISGRRFGRLVAVERIGSDKYGHSIWLCKCKCGNTTEVSIGSLTSGKTRSCGCLRREMSRKRFLKHGGAGHGDKTRLYCIWRAIKERCNYKNHVRYEDYGGRGISVCEEWEECYTTFRDWAIKNGYQESLQIDRIDNDKGYYPSNCRWVSAQEQANNKRNNHLLTHKGKTKTMAEWAREKEISYSTLRSRINQLDWPVDKALTKPVRGRKNATTTTN